MAKATRIQMPVGKALAQRIRASAEEIERSPRWLVRELLHVATENRKPIFEGVAQGIRDVLGGKKSAAGDLVRGAEYERFDIVVSGKAWAVVQLAAEACGHKASHMAGVLIEWGERYIGLVARVVQPHAEALKAVRS